MPIKTFSSFAVAHLLVTQPNYSFDCSAFTIKLFIPEKSQFYLVKNLQLIIVNNSRTGKDEFLLEVQFDRTTPAGRAISANPLCLSAKNADYLFDVLVDTNEPHPFLQAIPLTPLFPPDHPRHLSHQIPIDPPYTCSLTETHQLLQAHIPDLPPEIIQTWISPITVETTLMWPEPNEPASFYPEEYAFTVSSSSTRNRCALAADRTEGDHFLYILRNRILLCALFPQLLLYCTWGAAISPCYPHTVTCQIEPIYGLNPHQLWAFPSLPPCNPAVTSPQSIDLNSHPNISATHLFPPSIAFIPPTPGKTASEVLQQIKETLDNAHANTLTC